jgi:FkbM family methyltransferase
MFDFLFSYYRKSPMRIRSRIIKAMSIVRILGYLWGRKEVHSGGYKMQLNYADNGSFRYHRLHRKVEQAYERHLITALLAIVSRNKDSVFIDVGASYGAYTLAVASIGRHGLVQAIHAFEPDSRCHSALCRSIAANGVGDLVTCHNLIAGDYDGTACLMLSERASTSNRTFNSTEETLQFTSTKEVQCARIDTVLEREGVACRSLIVKIDVEGNERRVLDGMQKTLAETDQVALQIEYMPLAIREVGCKTMTMRSALAALQFDVAYLETRDGLVQFREIQNAWDHMESLEYESDYRYGGRGCNYIFCRNMDVSAVHASSVDTSGRVGIGESFAA